MGTRTAVNPPPMGTRTSATVNRPPSRNEHARGQSDPVGAAVCDGGVNFSVYSRDAAGVQLLLFDREDDTRPARVIPLDPALNRTYHYWHIFVPGLEPGQIYGYRAQGPYDPANGMRLTESSPDPYGRGFLFRNLQPRDGEREGNNSGCDEKASVDPPRTTGKGTARLDTSSQLSSMRPSANYTCHQFRRFGENARHYAGLIEKTPAAWHHAVERADLSVRRPGSPPGA